MYNLTAADNNVVCTFWKRSAPKLNKVLDFFGRLVGCYFLRRDVKISDFVKFFISDTGPFTTGKDVAASFADLSANSFLEAPA